MKLFLESGAISVVLFLILAIIGMISAVEKMKKEAKNPDTKIKSFTDKMFFVVNEVRKSIKDNGDNKSNEEIEEEEDEEAFWNRAVKRAKESKIQRSEVYSEGSAGETNDFREAVARSRQGSFVTSLPPEGISMTVSEQNAKKKEEKPAAQANGREECSGLKRRIKENPKDIIIFSEIMTPKFREF